MRSIDVKKEQGRGSMSKAEGAQTTMALVVKLNSNPAIQVVKAAIGDGYSPTGVIIRTILVAT